MAKAYKCDICGKFFEPKLEPERRFMTISQAWIQRGAEFGNGKHYDADIHNYDFCNKCSELMITLLSEWKGEENEKEVFDTNRANCGDIDSDVETYSWLFGGRTGGN